MTFEVSVKDMLRCHGICLVKKELSIMFDNKVDGKVCDGINNNDTPSLRRFIKKNDMMIALSDDLIGTMNLVNKMVKDKDACQGRLRNRFYCLKHSVLKMLIHTSVIDEIIDNGKFYLFNINGYEFHQPKDYFKISRPVVNGSEDYIPDNREIVFDYQTYVLAMATMAYFVNTYDINKEFSTKGKMKVNEVDKYRSELIEMLHKFNEGNLNFFKRLWAHNNLDISIEDAVNNLDIKDLAIVYYQAKNTLK